jgi:hypothetical protein
MSIRISCLHHGRERGPRSAAYPPRPCVLAIPFVPPAGAGSVLLYFLTQASNCQSSAWPRDLWSDPCRLVRRGRITTPLIPSLVAANVAPGLERGTLAIGQNGRWLVKNDTIRPAGPASGKSGHPRRMAHRRPLRGPGRSRIQRTLRTKASFGAPASGCRAAAVTPKSLALSLRPQQVRDCQQSDACPDAPQPKNLSQQGGKRMLERAGRSC